MQVTIDLPPPPPDTKVTVTMTLTEANVLFGVLMMVSVEYPDKGANEIITRMCRAFGVAGCTVTRDLALSRR